MRRKSLLLLVGAAAVLAVACRDAVSPTHSASPFSSSASPEFSKSGTNSNRTELGTLELSPNGGTYHVGDFDVVIPAGAVCDPATTKYGPRHWDRDCSPLKRTLTVNVVAQRSHGAVSVDFQPDLRFRPSAGSVRIQTSAFADLLKSSDVRQLSPTSSYFNQFLLLYSPTGQATRIDEVRSLGD